MQEAADKLAAYVGYSGKRAARDAAAPDAWDAEEAPDSEVDLCCEHNVNYRCHTHEAPAAYAACTYPVDGVGC